MRLWILLISLLGWKLIKAQGPFPTDLLAGLEAYSQKPLYLSAGFDHQASLARMKSPGFAISGRKAFMQIIQARSGLVVPVQAGSFGLQGIYFGNRLYQQTGVSLSYGRSMQGVDLGLQFNYYSRSIPGYYRSGAIGCEAGMMVQLHEAFRTGIHVSNPVSTVWSKTDEKIRSVYSIGLGYEPSSILLVAIHIYKAEEEPAGFQAGIRYKFHDKIIASLGLSTSHESMVLGVQYGLKSVSLNCSLGWHRTLGHTPGFGLQYLKDK